MTEDKFKEAERLINNLKKYEHVERVLRPDTDLKLLVGYSGRNEVSGNTIEYFLGEDFKQLQATINTLVCAAIEVRRNKLQAEFDKL